MLRRLLREPLLHFLLLGGLMFAVFGRGNSEAGAYRPAHRGERSRHRPPCRGILADLESPAGSERATGADPGLRPRGGTLSRRRFNLGSTRTTASSVADCGRRWSSCSKTRFRRRRRRNCARISSPTLRSSAPAPLISFRQVFVSTRRGAAAEPDARQILASLVTDTPGAADEADPSAAGRHVQPDAARSGRRPAWRRLRSRAGACSAWALGRVPCDPHTGCIWSWLRQSSRPQRHPSNSCAPAVEREWFAERRSAAQAAQYQAVLAGYKVTVQDWPARDTMIRVASRARLIGLLLRRLWERVRTRFDRRS